MSESIRKHYDDSENVNAVADRFGVYGEVIPNIDIHNEEVRLLSEMGRLAVRRESGQKPVVLDVGSSRGDMLERLKLAGFQGNYIGLDLSRTQLLPFKDQLLFTQPDVLLVNADAAALPIPNKSIDVSLVNFMLYHQNKAQRKKTYKEVKRVTKPDGVIIAATSGAINKGQQRMYEFLVAEELGYRTKAPKPMTMGFNSERAETEIPENFRGWHFTWVNQYGIFKIDNERRVDKSLTSMRTLRGLFKPEPTPEAFEVVMTKIKQQLMQRITDGHPVVDNIHRTFVIASPEPTGLPERIVLS